MSTAGTDCLGATSHGHGEGSRESARRLLIALVLTASFLVVEVIGGLWFNSLALLSDAVHMLADTGALALALAAQRIALRPRTAERTYGFRRAETLAAFVNGITLGVGAVWICIEAIERIGVPPDVDSMGMLVVAGIGLLVNLACAWVLSRGVTGHSHDLNTRAALYHVLSDAAGSVGAIIAALVMLFTGWMEADAVVSILLAALILFGAWNLVKKATAVLMEGAPDDAQAHEITVTIRDTEGVLDLHDLHVWSIAHDFPVVTVHVTVADASDACAVAQRVVKRLHDQHGIAHATVQPEVG